MVACLGACGGVPRVLAVLIISCSRCHDCGEDARTIQATAVSIVFFSTTPAPRQTRKNFICVYNVRLCARSRGNQRGRANPPSTRSPTPKYNPTSTSTNKFRVKNKCCSLWYGCNGKLTKVLSTRVPKVQSPLRYRITESMGTAVLLGSTK